MSLENVMSLEGQIMSIIKGYGKGSAQQVLQNAPTVAGSIQSFSTLVQNYLSTSFLDDFVCSLLSFVIVVEIICE